MRIRERRLGGRRGPGPGAPGRRERRREPGHDAPGLRAGPLSRRVRPHGPGQRRRPGGPLGHPGDRARGARRLRRGLPPPPRGDAGPPCPRRLPSPTGRRAGAPRLRLPGERERSPHDARGARPGGGEAVPLQRGGLDLRRRRRPRRIRESHRRALQRGPGGRGPEVVRGESPRRLHRRPLRPGRRRHQGPLVPLRARAPGPAGRRPGPRPAGEPRDDGPHRRPPLRGGHRAHARRLLRHLVPGDLRRPALGAGEVARLPAGDRGDRRPPLRPRGRGLGVRALRSRGVQRLPVDVHEPGVLLALGRRHVRAGDGLGGLRPALRLLLRRPEPLLVPGLRDDEGAGLRPHRRARALRRPHHGGGAHDRGRDPVALRRQADRRGPRRPRHADALPPAGR